MLLLEVFAPSEATEALLNVDRSLLLPLFLGLFELGKVILSVDDARYDVLILSNLVLFL